MKKIPFFIITFLFAITACKDALDENPSTNQMIVLKERDPSQPFTASDYRSIFTKQSTANVSAYPVVSHNAYLGRSLKDNVYPLEDTRNIGYQIIDITRLFSDYPSYLTAWKTNGGEATSFSYATFDRYTTTSTIRKKVNGGFKLSLGLFSIGARRTNETVFTKTFTEDQNSVFGELNVVVRDSSFRIQTSSNILQEIKTRYLTTDFQNELYNTHPSELFSNYGGFILAEYVIGGKATAIYGGTYKRTESSETQEKDMNTEIDGSYGFKRNADSGKVSGDLKVGRKDSNSTSITNEFTTIKVSVKTVGGNSSFAAFSIPKELKSADIDLSGWISSLNDKSTHSLIELADNGLIPITDLITERNLQNTINSYYNSGVASIEALKEPHITIDLSAYRNNQLFVVSTYLHTRFGDKIVLKSEELYRKFRVGGTRFNDSVKAYYNNEAARISKIFGLRISTTNLISTVSVKGSAKASATPTTNFDFDGFGESYLKKYVHNGTIYIVSDYFIDKTSFPANEFAGKRFALSIHRDQFIDQYAMRAFIDRLPTIDLDYQSFIRDYTIDAL